MIIGIDEVGRGCWAGPLVAAAVGFKDGIQIDGLADSKQVPAQKRIQLAEEIKSKTAVIGIGWVWPEEINDIGLTESVRLAMQRAVDELNQPRHTTIIDGNINYLAHLPDTTAVTKADGSIPAVSAASIIAKVARDTYMQEIAEAYPQYGFEKHVGYGTPAHRLALEQYGVSELHRVNYKPIQKLLVHGP